MKNITKINRRTVLSGGASLGGLVLAGCSTSLNSGGTVSNRVARALYRAMPDERFAIPAVDLKKVDKKYYRREVVNPTGAAPGTVYVDTKNFYRIFTSISLVKITRPCATVSALAGLALNGQARAELPGKGNGQPGRLPPK